MKHVLKKTAAGLLIAGMIATANAQAPSGQASMEVNQKIMAELMQELPAEKMADSGFVMDKMIEKMKANLPELKAASQKDCVAIYGDAKSDACSCVTEKTDYNEVFDLMKKQAANPSDASLSADLEKLAKKGEEQSLACGFSKEEIDAATQKAMEAAQQAAPQK